MCVTSAKLNGKLRSLKASLLQAESACKDVSICKASDWHQLPNIVCQGRAQMQGPSKQTLRILRPIAVLS